MLNRLTISNFALIDNIDLQFKSGYSVITGETGAGKSIILKALNLLLGNRADYSVIKLKDEKCVIEAEFDIADLSLENLFSDFDLDFDTLTILRREFLPSGKSRLFINDTPTTLNVLKVIGHQIIKIHTQHETLDLFDKQFQLNTLDAYAGNTVISEDYRLKFSKFQQQLKVLEQLREKVNEQRKAQDYTAFLIGEFQAINFEKLDIDALLEEAEQIQNWEQIQNQLSATLSILSDDQLSPSSAIKRGTDALGKIEHLSSKYHSLYNRFQSVKIELDDIEAELTDIVSESEVNEERMAIVQNQVEAINSLLFKHNASNGTELQTVLDKLESEIHSYSNLEEEIIAIENASNDAESELKLMALELSQKRRSASSGFESATQKVLEALGMPNAEIKIDLSQTDTLSNRGFDEIQYLFKTNLGGQYLPVSKTASGGELSRLMLSILYIISSVKNLPTMVFDEIDTGVSGEIASKMAALFSKMGAKTQLISITHLPQIASKARAHYHVFKTVSNNTTSTMVKELDEAERITELAKMMSGAQISTTAIENAKQLLES